MTDKTTFFIRDHQEKGQAYEQAMRNAGWKPADYTQNPTVALFDSDVTKWRIDRINKMPESCLIFLFGHTARPPLWYDFRECHPHPKTTAIFVPSIGHKQVLDRIGVTKPVHIVGWSFCDQREFAPVSKIIRKVTFAPIHANTNGWNAPVNQEINHKIMDRLLEAQKAHSFDITVRYLRSLDSCGLHRISNVKYVLGLPDQSFKEIDTADLVIGTETYAYLAIARGKPTLMMAENVPPRIGNSQDNFDYVKSWDKYRDIMEYPLDSAVGNLWDTMQSACKPREDVSSWRERMIGDPFSPTNFIKIVKQYIDVNANMV